MSQHLNVYDLNLKKAAILENAFNIREARPINGLYSLSFEIPDIDPKNNFCNPYWFVRYGDNGDYYRILSGEHQVNEAGIRTYECEHAIGTLIDDLIWGVGGTSNIVSTESIKYILNKQTTKRWQLGVCDFDAKYEYLWTDENLLNALFSIPKPWTTPYMWMYDFSSYPWKINLKAININAAPDYYIRAKKNLLSSNEKQSNSDICTRLYALGYGEGVNQLTIESVNNKVPYIQSPQSIINKYGLVSRLFVDRSIEDPKLLLARAKATLEELQEPRMSRTFDVVDLYPITNDPIDQAEVGKIARLVEDQTTTYITETVRTLDNPGDLTIKLSTKSTDVANAIAELADRQRIEATYAQGSTQLYAQSISENATSTKGAKLSFYIPNEMRYVNAVKAKIILKRFRAFNRQTKGGGKTTRTSSAEGKTTQTSTASGNAVISTNNSGEVNVTSNPSQEWTHGMTLAIEETEGCGDLSMTGTADLGSSTRTTTKTTAYPGQQHDHKVDIRHYHALRVSGGNHKHRVKLPMHSHIMRHTHDFYAPAHTHQVSLPAHSHSVTIPEHTHKVDIPDHTHEIEQGIFEYGSPKSADIYIEGIKRLTINQNGEFDLTGYIVNSSGKIPRGQWIDVEVRPNDIAYIVIHIFVQGFIQSRGGGNY